MSFCCDVLNTDLLIISKQFLDADTLGIRLQWSLHEPSLCFQLVLPSQGSPTMGALACFLDRLLERLVLGRPSLASSNTESELLCCRLDFKL